jgi:hypothetical protein
MSPSSTSTDSVEENSPISIWDSLYENTIPTNEALAILVGLRPGRPLPRYTRQLNDGRTLEDALAFVQTWAFFGMLHEVHKIARIPFTLHDYIIVPDGLPLITTIRLSQLEESWKQRVKGLPELERKLRTRKVDFICRTANDFVRALEKRGTLVLETGLTFSIALVAQRLVSMSSTVHGIPMSYYSANSDFLNTHFKSNGWCPSRISAIKTTSPNQYVCLFV